MGLSAPCEVVSSSPGLSHGNVRAPRAAQGAVQHMAGRWGGAQDSLACVFHSTRGLVQGWREKGTITRAWVVLRVPVPLFQRPERLGESRSVSFAPVSTLALGMVGLQNCTNLLWEGEQETPDSPGSPLCYLGGWVGASQRLGPFFSRIWVTLMVDCCGSVLGNQQVLTAWHLDHGHQAGAQNIPGSTGYRSKTPETTQRPIHRKKVSKWWYFITSFSHRGEFCNLHL